MSDEESTATLSPEEIEAVTARLGSGEYLDDYYRQLLFRQPKEYELKDAAMAALRTNDSYL